MANNPSYKVKYQATSTTGVASSMYIDFKEGKKKCEAESCHKVELADDTEEGAVPKVSDR